MQRYLSLPLLLAIHLLLGCKQSDGMPKNTSQELTRKKTTTIEYYQNYYQGDIENPKNIVNSANDLLRDTNQKEKQNWQLTDSPNLFYQAKCQIPLKVKWIEKLDVAKFDKGDSEFWSIIVSCNKAKSIYNSDGGWDVRFITNRPNGRQEKDFPKNPKTFVQEDLGNKTDQGLKYVNDRAIELIHAYNQQNHTNWESLEPDARIGIEKCAVPMIATWLDPSKEEPYKNEYYSPNLWYVKVTCSKTIAYKDYPNGRNWDIIIPTTRQIHPIPTFKEFVANSAKL